MPPLEHSNQEAESERSLRELSSRDRYILGGLTLAAFGEFLNSNVILAAGAVLFSAAIFKKD